MQLLHLSRGVNGAYASPTSSHVWIALSTPTACCLRQPYAQLTLRMCKHLKRTKTDRRTAMELAWFW